MGSDVQTWSQLELREDAGRYYLAGRPVHVGDVVELLRDGRSLLGRFYWNRIRGSAPHFVLNMSELTKLPLDVAADFLRWPERFN